MNKKKLIMIKFLNKPEVLLTLFALSSLILGWNVSQIIREGFAVGKELLTEILNISGWIFMTIFFFYFFIKRKKERNAKMIYKKLCTTTYIKNSS